MRYRNAHYQSNVITEYSVTKRERFELDVQSEICVCETNLFWKFKSGDYRPKVSNDLPVSHITWKGHALLAISDLLLTDEWFHSAAMKNICPQVWIGRARELFRKSNWRSFAFWNCWFMLASKQQSKRAN